MVIATKWTHKQQKTFNANIMPGSLTSHSRLTIRVWLWTRGVSGVTVPGAGAGPRLCSLIRRCPLSSLVTWQLFCPVTRCNVIVLLSIQIGACPIFRLLCTPHHLELLWCKEYFILIFIRDGGPENELNYWKKWLQLLSSVPILHFNAILKLPDS